MKHKCEKDGCVEQESTACYLPDDDGVTEYLCWKHAVEEGYCPCCGGFFAGTGEEFHNNGICDNCSDDIAVGYDDPADEFPMENEEYL